VSANETEAGDTDLIVHEEVPSTIDKSYRKIFKDMEEQPKTHNVKIGTVMKTVI
jgi:hypothetical protein